MLLRAAARQPEGGNHFGETEDGSAGKQPSKG